ncbi:hypothetical protein CPC08DRAFT_62827 [Agrocybe pediades]|nr:hypothetical protein CPC08DRAFT_62827 [Agrocybe pediades]
MLTASLFTLSAIAGLLLTAALSFTRYYGHILKVSRLSFTNIQNFSYFAPGWYLYINNVKFDYHWPTKKAPYVLIVTADGYEYKDEAVHVSVDHGEVKIWVFPKYFRLTAGPWIASKVDGFVMKISSSRRAPWFVDLLKSNITHSVIDGDTIRLNALSMKTMFGQFAVPDVEHTVDDVAKIGLHDGEVNDELRVRISTSQWHVLAPWSSRIYSYDDLQAELRKNWTDDNRGTFVLIAKECRWTKVPNYEQEERFRRMSLPGAIFSTLCSIPKAIYEACQNPMSMVDIHAVRTDVTFTDFHLRDARLIKAATDKAKEEFVDYSTRHPGVIQNIAWDMFLSEVLSALL